MGDSSYTAKEKRRGRNNYQVFQVFNVFTFTVLSGSVLTLFALKLGADSFFIGILASLSYFGFFLMILGRTTVRRIGAKRQWGLGWFFRNITMLPIFFAPLAVSSGRYTAAMLLIFFPFLGFNICKGMGLVGTTPVVGALSEGKDRGSFLAKLQIILNSALIGTNLLVAVVLGQNAPMSRYLVLMATAISLGLFSTVFIFRIPAPVADRKKNTGPLIPSIIDGLKRKDFRYFIILASVTAMVIGLANPFVILYAKRIYGLRDNLVVYLLVVGNFGAIMMGIAVRKLIDRMGPKPLYIVFQGILCISIIAIIISPSLPSAYSLLFLALLFFLYNFGLAGGMNAAQNYFYAVTDTTEHLNLGLLYNVVGGLSSTISSLVGGVVLGSFQSTFVLEVNAFRSLYGIVFVVLLVCFPLLLKLKNSGQFTVRSAFAVLLSRKDLRAVALLHKLDKTKTTEEEVQVIDSLADLDSPVTVADLLTKLKSPRFYVRSRALRALERQSIDDRLAEVLISEVKNHAFTTANVAARILGRRGIKRGTKILRASLDSNDYLLVSESMLALARLGDERSITKFENILKSSSNPLVQIYAAASLDILSSIKSLPALFEALKQPDPPPYLRDEIILSIAGILDLSDWFYDYYSQFLEKSKTGAGALAGYAKDAMRDSEDLLFVEGLLSRMLDNRLAFGSDIQRRYEALITPEREYLRAFYHAAADNQLLRFDRVAFLLAAVLVKYMCDDVS